MNVRNMIDPWSFEELTYLRSAASQYAGAFVFID